MQEKSLDIAILLLTAVGGAHYPAKMMETFGIKRGAPADHREGQKKLV